MSEPLPHSRAAEEAVLGAILFNPGAYFDAARQLPYGAEEFFIHKLRFIWEAYVRLQERQAPIDSLTVSNELEDMGRLEEIGGPAYLTALLNQTPTSLNVDEYARIVDAAYTRRRLLGAANEIAQAAYDLEKGIDETLVAATGAMTTAVKQATRSRMLSGKEAIRAMDDRIMSRHSGEIFGIPTGYKDLDALFGGAVEGGKLICIAGRPGTGKSALLTGMGVHAIDSGYHPAIFSMEMDAEEVAERMVAQLSGLDAQLVHRASFSDDQWPIYNHAIETLAGTTEWSIDYTAGMTVEYIALQCEMLQARGLLDAVYIDQLDKLRTHKQFTKTVEKYDFLMNALKVEIAMRFGVPVFVAAQMNRSAEKEANRRPKLSDLNEGGEKDADVVIFIWKDDEQPNVRHLVVEKHRGGPTGVVDTIWRGNCVRFESAEMRVVDLVIDDGGEDE
jgi:replicative DNA helicase